MWTANWPPCHTLETARGPQGIGQEGDAVRRRKLERMRAGDCRSVDRSRHGRGVRW